ncbi:MAG: hypothetical protein H7Z39_19750, partial [Burkholderiaceae bacterium]|nr:hypothetical protein [Burkholderiaceae bacterium]
MGTAPHAEADLRYVHAMDGEGARKLRIALIDDEPGYLRAILRKAPDFYEIDTYLSGEALLAALGEH